MEQLKLSNQICHRYYVASNAITRAYRPLLEPLGLTYPQYVVMMALWEKDEIEVKSLKNKTLIDGGALTLILKKLESKGQLRLEPSSQDRRNKFVILTNQGCELRKQAADIPKKLMCQVPGFSHEDFQQLSSLTDRVIAAFAE